VILGALGLLLLVAFTVTSLGVLMAVWIKQAQTFTAVMQMFVFPMFFLSGALYPRVRVGDLAGRADPDRSADLRGGRDAPHLNRFRKRV